MEKQKWGIVSRALLASCLASSGAAFASDHIDGPVTTKHRVADLSDLYVYPTPGKEGFVTIILNAYPVVPPPGHFDDKVTYKISVRRAAIAGEAGAPRIETSADGELTLRCSFVTPRTHEKHVATCETSTGMRSRVTFNSTKSAGGDFPLFAGMRTDPFFFDALWSAAATKGRLLPAKGLDTMDSLNVLSLVMELPVARLFPGHSLLAFAAEAFAQDKPSAPIRRTDRLGRPEITNVSLFSPKGAEELRDAYNGEGTFEVSAARMATYRERLARNVAFYDGLDGKAEWSPKGIESLTTLLLEDFLVVDMAKPCDENSFLEIERSLLKGVKPTSCGGRRPTDDIMDTMYTLYVAGLNGARVGDGVDKPSRELAKEFPYLVAPEVGAGARVKAAVARKLLGI